MKPHDSSPSAAAPVLAAEDVLLPVLNHRAHEILDSYNHLRGPVAAPLNVTAILQGLPDAGAAGSIVLHCWEGGRWLLSCAAASHSLLMHIHAEWRPKPGRHTCLLACLAQRPHQGRRSRRRRRGA